MNQNNLFAKLGALEQKLYQETSSQQVDIKSQISGIPENQNTTKREFYTKVTYRICDEAVDALEDAKKHLKRQYKLKVNMEEVVETAIIEIYRDLIEKGEKSVLVTKYSGNPENQNT